MNPRAARRAVPMDDSLRQLLWEARESLQLWADVIERRAGRRDDYTRDLIKRIEAAYSAGLPRAVQADEAKVSAALADAEVQWADVLERLRLAGD